MSGVRSDGSGLDRRQLLGATALLAAGIGLPYAAYRSQARLDANGATQAHRILFDRVADLLIPPTQTPGGAAAGAGAFALLALHHGLGAAQPPVKGAAIPVPAPRFMRGDGTLDHIAWLEDALNHAANGDFIGTSEPRQSAALAAVDAAAFPPGPPPPPERLSPWVRIKGLLLTGYYTSEIGGARELRYELVPGRWEPDLPLKSGDRAWSSDWTAVEFG